jgi:hypothetical protein
MRRLVIGPAAQHGLEKARRLHDLELAAFQLAAAEFDHQISVPFDPGEVMQVDV